MKTIFGKITLLLMFFLLLFSTALSASYTNEDIYKIKPLAKNVKMTDDYIREVAQASYLWAWPMVNMHNRQEIVKELKEPSYMGGIAPVAPINQLSMLTDYIDASERLVAAPNQDVVYGFGLFSLEKEPVIVQIPDFKGRYWLYQIGDQRTDELSEIGSMYKSKPGFYLLAGPDWKGTVPDGISGVLRIDTNLGFITPRVFVTDDPKDKAAIQPIINQILMYPLSQYDGKMKIKDWKNTTPKVPGAAPSGSGETQWVVPEKFVDELPLILKEVPPMEGEENLYAGIKQVLDYVNKNPQAKKIFTDAVIKTDKEILAPLFEPHNYGTELSYNWHTFKNGAQFKKDYMTRAAVAKSNIFANKYKETAYFSLEFDSNKVLLNGSNKYTLTFNKGQLPPVEGFWSLTAYDQYHFFIQNEMSRYSIGTKTKNLKYNKDGSLTLYIQSEKPSADRVSNWLPVKDGERFVLFIRSYWPKNEILNGSWTPPAIQTMK